MPRFTTPIKRLYFFAASIILSVSLLCLAGWTTTDAGKLKPFYIRGFAQGSTYSITYFAADSLVNVSQTDSILLRIDSSMSIYKPFSLINQFNQSEKGMAIDAHFANVVRRSLEICRNTNGSFDITVQPLVKAWGFGAKPGNNTPTDDTIKQLLQCVGCEKISLQQNFLHKQQPCVTVDVNGIAQGYSVDVLADFLAAKHIENYLVELGGEIRIKGRKPSGGRLRIAIEAPGDDPYLMNGVQRIIALDSGAVTTSGNYRRYRQAGNKRITHLIDAKTGYPVENELISVTVIAKDAMTADGYDNPLMNMGLAGSFQFLKQHPELEAFFIYHTPNGEVADTATAGFYRLLQPVRQ